MTREDEFRAQAARTQLKLAALDMIDQLSSNLPTGHTISCNAEDMTGWPAACSCGFDKNQDVKTIAFMRQAIINAE